MRNLGEVQYDTGIPKHYYTPGAGAGLGEVQYDTGIPKHYYTPGAGMSLGQTSADFAQAGAATRSGLLDFFQSYKAAELQRKQLRVSERINTIKANLQFLSQQEQIAAQAELNRLQTELSQVKSELLAQTVVDVGKILALTSVTAIGLIGMFYVLSRD